MEREQKPVLIVEETGIDFVLHDRALACKLRTRVRDLDGVTGLVLPLVRDLVRLGLPDPRTGEFQLQRGQIDVERVADRVDLTKRVETIGLGNLVGDGRALLRRHRCRRTKHSDQQNTDHRNAARFRHGRPPSAARNRSTLSMTARLSRCAGGASLSCFAGLLNRVRRTWRPRAASRTPAAADEY